MMKAPPRDRLAMQSRDPIAGVIDHVIKLARGDEDARRLASQQGARGFALIAVALLALVASVVAIVLSLLSLR